VIGATRLLQLVLYNVDPQNRTVYVAAPLVSVPWVNGYYLADSSDAAQLDTVQGLAIEGNSSVSIYVNVVGTELNITELTSASSTFNGVVWLRWWSSEDNTSASLYAVNTTIMIVTVLVTPTVFTYNVQSGSVYQCQSSGSGACAALSPTPLVSIFNNLCENSIAYTVLPCNPDVPIPAWFKFDSEIGMEHTIPPQKGLPDSLPFHLDFTGQTNDDLESRAALPAETKSFCFEYFVRLLGIGANVSTPVTVNVTATVDCPLGYVSPTGRNEIGCSECNLGSYANFTGGQTCLACPAYAPATLFNASTDISACVAGANSYMLPNQNVSQPCPVQAFCNGTGTTLETLWLRPGYWRTYQGSVNFIACPQPQFCIGGLAPPEQIDYLDLGRRRRMGDDDNNTVGNNTAPLCYLHSTGMLCQQCEAGYVHRGAYRYCDICSEENTADDRARISGIMVGLSLAFVAVAIYLGLRLYFMHSELPEGRTSMIREASSRFDFVLHTIDGGTKLKIIVGLLQVVSGMSVQFAAVLPASFLQFAALFSVLALDLIALFDFGCALPDQNHYASLLLTTLLPILVCVCIATCYVVFTVFLLRDQPQVRADVRTLCYTLFLFVLFLVYPSVSSGILKTWLCDSFDDGTRWLQVDHTLSCQVPAYTYWVIYSVVMFFVYVVGVPVTYTVLLYRERERLNPPFSRDVAIEVRKGDPAIQHVKFLWEAYRPRFYWFEVWELVRKLVQTSVLVFVAAGTSLQMIFQLGVTLVSVFILHVARPYIFAGDLYLALSAQWAIFAISFLSLLIKLDQSATTPTFDKNTMQTLLLAIFLLVPAIAGAQLIFNVVVTPSVRNTMSSSRFMRLGGLLRAAADRATAAQLDNKFDEIEKLKAELQNARQQAVALGEGRNELANELALRELAEESSPASGPAPAGRRSIFAVGAAFVSRRKTLPNEEAVRPESTELSVVGTQELHKAYTDEDNV